jgi:cardiolipin synthase
MGGINVGNYYTHQYGVPESERVEAAKWRDTDVFLSGPVVGDIMQKFQRFWNSQINDNQLSVPLLNYYIDSTKYETKGNSQVIYTMMKPGDQDISILYSIMFLICHAQKTIDIENAYLIEVPGFHEAIQNAIQHGVRVRIFTNSQFSIDEAIIFDSVSLYLKKLFDAGAEIYLKRGSDTLHSKFLIVDSEIVNIGSMNLHPRSLYIEWEANCTIKDLDVATSFTQVFENDISDSNAFRLLSKDQLPDLSNLSSKFMKYFFYRNL